jgi:hypothetical protein
MWSSPSTWGGNPVPDELSTVVIPAGQNVVLDYDPPVLYMIIVLGSLTFARADIHLQAGYIFVFGGTLTVGTETEPFEQQATITLYGNPVSQELPIYGAKMIACRECTLDLHGKPVAHTWTSLGEPAHAGDNTITLMQSVDWPVGGIRSLTSSQSTQQRWRCGPLRSSVELWRSRTMARFSRCQSRCSSTIRARHVRTRQAMAHSN